MTKPIDKLDFWKSRIETAREIRNSVYVANDTLWERIDAAHKAIIDIQIGKDEFVLDAGCGYGRLSPLFRRYVGLDFSPDFIALAKEKYPEKTFVVGDLKKPPFTRLYFDWAVCVSIRAMVQGNLGEEAWEEMERGLRRVARRILILEYEEPTKFEVIV